jgi:hypothetical protein
VRKELGFSIDEWDAMPWWQQRVYIEQLELYAAIQRGEHIPDDLLPDDDSRAVTDDSLTALGFSVESG